MWGRHKLSISFVQPSIDCSTACETHSNNGICKKKYLKCT